MGKKMVSLALGSPYEASKPQFQRCTANSRPCHAHKEKVFDILIVTCYYSYITERKYGLDNRVCPKG